MLIVQFSALFCPSTRCSSTVIVAVVIIVIIIIIIIAIVISIVIAVVVTIVKIHLLVINVFGAHFLKR